MIRVSSGFSARSHNALPTREIGNLKLVSGEDEEENGDEERGLVVIERVISAGTQNTLKGDPSLTNFFNVYAGEYSSISGCIPVVYWHTGLKYPVTRESLV